MQTLSCFVLADNGSYSLHPALWFHQLEAADVKKYDSMPQYWSVESPVNIFMRLISAEHS
jgi:hypothetical protein